MHEGNSGMRSKCSSRFTNTQRDECERSSERNEITHNKDAREHNLTVVQKEAQLRPYNSIANQIENVWHGQHIVKTLQHITIIMTSNARINVTSVLLQRESHDHADV